MSAEIGPGTALICVEGLSPIDCGNYPEMAISVGSLYFCERIEHYAGPPNYLYHPNCDTSRVILLKGRAGAMKGLRWIGYCFCHFRPLNDGDTSLVENEQDIDTDQPIIRENTKELV